MSNRTLPRAVLIGSASLVTIAFVAIAGQTVNWTELSRSLTQQPDSTEQEPPDRVVAVEPEEAVDLAQRKQSDMDVASPRLAPQAERSRMNNTAVGNRALYAGAPSPAPATVSRVVIDPKKIQQAQPDRERFSSEDPNPLKSAASDPVSTFSIDVDTASYSYVRSALTDGYLPKPDAVRVEEMINYFDYGYRAPENESIPFSTSISVVETPWNADTKLMQIGIQGYRVPLEDLPPQNLVFLIDTSGSMADANKLPLLQQSFRLLLSSLRDEDEVAIVTYAGSAGVLLEPTKVAEKAVILDKINALTSGGSTAGHEGLKGAYALAEKMTGEGEQTRVILATDGDFNVGLSDNDSLKRFVSEKRKSGTALSVLGFGRGNYNDELMQTLAQNGQGVATYIDTLSEARKVLVDQVVSSISMIAQDVKIQVEFNPATVAEYRLIGYETRALKTEDFRNDKVDAGDIGAGHNVTALYEITPVGSPAEKFPERRYGAKPSAGGSIASAYAGELAFVKLRYKKPGETKSRLIETPVHEDTRDIPLSETLFAASVASFGQMLKGTDYLGDWNLQTAEKLARENKGADRFGYRSEFLTILRLAQVAGH